jgi:hypothetical protein
MTALADRGTSGNAVGVILVPLQTGYDPGATNLTTGGRSGKATPVGLPVVAWWHESGEVERQPFRW